MSDELENLRKKRLQELQDQARRSQQEEEMQQQEAERAYENQVQTLMRSILTDSARQRLSNVKLVKPQLAKSIEAQLIQLYQSGRLGSQLITEEQLLQMLRQVQGNRRESKIKFKRV